MARSLGFLSIFLAIPFSLLVFTMPGYAFELTDDNLSFYYQPNEFEGAPCTHERVRDLPDWTVKCESRYHKKEFGVHLIARKYLGGNPQRTKFEVLYWVANRNKKENKNEYTGTTLNFELNDDVKANEIRIGQMVDGGYANLDMTIKVNR